MKSIAYFIIISTCLAFLTVTILIMLWSWQSEFGIIGLFPGFMLNWATEQILIEILREPYFTLDNIDYWFDLSAFGQSGKALLILIAKNLTVVFSFIFYSIIYFSIVYSGHRLKRSIYEVL